MTVKPVYQTSVENKPIWVIDTLSKLDEIVSIYNGLEASAFKKHEIARPDTANFKHWVVNLSEQQTKTFPLYSKVISAVTEMTGNTYRAYRSYVNYSSYGDMLFTHTDCLPNSNELTVLIYICPKWDIEWGGETMFYNDANDCVYACTPKPGRAIVFDGSIKHVGRPPNRLCFEPRYTLAFKLEAI